MPDTADGDDVGPLFPPPADFAQQQLPIIELTQSWQRIHACDRDAIYFSRTGSTRFRAPHGEYGVMYSGADAFCAFVETFGRLDAGGDSDFRVVDVGMLSVRCLSEITATRPLRLVDLTGSGLRRIGADARLCSGEHAMARLWALAMWAHPSQPDGILYPTRHDLSRKCAAIFDRAADIVRAGKPRRLIELPWDLLGEILDAYWVLVGRRVRDRIYEPCARM